MCVHVCLCAPLCACMCYLGCSLWLLLWQQGLSLQLLWRCVMDKRHTLVIFVMPKVSFICLLCVLVLPWKRDCKCLWVSETEGGQRLQHQCYSLVLTQQVKEWWQIRRELTVSFLMSLYILCIISHCVILAVIELRFICVSPPVLDPYLQAIELQFNSLFVFVYL